ncbi:MAG: NAD(P)/FAD-dependent oxidoreductase [Candidatus Paceibacterota bacterium]|jgi:hypothetical protein
MAKQASKENIFDVAVIGAGPAGMMAAGRAAELGARVVLLEKNLSAGQKLLLTGNGRCNLANAEFDLKKLTENYGKNGSFLFHAFSEFGPKDTIGLFEKLGVKTKIEDKNRVFPQSNKAKDVLDAMIEYLKKGKVEIIYGSEVKNIEKRGSAIKGLVLASGDRIAAKNYIFCSGGQSYPLTGSTGDGFKWAADLGHSVSRLYPSLVPIKLSEEWASGLQGLVLDGVELKLTSCGKKIKSQRGSLVFAHFGISGPAVLNLSKEISPLPLGQLKIGINLFPDIDFEELEKGLEKKLSEKRGKEIENCLVGPVPWRFISVLLSIVNIDPEKKAGNISRLEINNLAKLFLNVEVTPIGTLGFEEAMATKGGISLKEIDHKTMRSKIMENLFFAGEVIDIDGLTGGFNLQNCWSTGRLAGESAAKGKE